MKSLIALIVLTTNSGKVPVRLVDYLERQFPDSKIEVKSAFSFYKANRNFPTPACMSATYYVLEQGGALRSAGCIDAVFPGDGVRAITAQR